MKVCENFGFSRIKLTEPKSITIVQDVFMIITIKKFTGSVTCFHLFLEFFNKDLIIAVF